MAQGLLFDDLDVAVRPPKIDAVKSDWRPPTEFPNLRGCRRIAIDVETKDSDLLTLGPGPRRAGNYLIGIAVGTDRGERAYLPYRHQGGDNLDEAMVIKWAVDNLSTFDGEVVGANLAYDLDWLETDGIAIPNATFRDIQFAECLIDEHRFSYSLDNIALHHLNESKQEAMLDAIAASTKGRGNIKSRLWELAARYVGPYAEGDVDLPLRIYEIQEKLLTENELWPIYNLESDLLPLFLKMQQQGVPVSEERLDNADAFFRAEEAAAYATIRKESGFDLSEDIWASAKVAPALRSLGFTVPDGDSVEQQWLLGLKHPAADAIVHARKMSQAVGTFTSGIRKHLTNGRVHPNYNQVRGERGGTVTGRPSCANPNLLNQPTRDEIVGPIIRGVYVPDAGKQWAKLDFSQQEPRLSVHYAELTNGCDAAEAVKMYSENPDTDYHSMMAELTGLPRSKAKAMFLGICYGMGGGKLCRDMGLPTVTKSFKKNGETIEYLAAGPEGEKILTQFDIRAPFVKGIDKKAKERAQSRGYITTLLGRRLHFRASYEYRKALNKLIQGSAADQTKKAMLDVWREGGMVPYLQVYDELDVPVDNYEEARYYADIMERAVPLVVPSKVDVEIGASWGEAK
jgi:DNA polymerase I-like protein with 3'-5' exonuclease and polymerase domains